MTSGKPTEAISVSKTRLNRTWRALLRFCKRVQLPLKEAAKLHSGKCLLGKWKVARTKYEAELTRRLAALRSFLPKTLSSTGGIHVNTATRKSGKQKRGRGRRKRLNNSVTPARIVESAKPISIQDLQAPLSVELEEVKDQLKAEVQTRKWVRENLESQQELLDHFKRLSGMLASRSAPSTLIKFRSIIELGERRERIFRESIARLSKDPVYTTRSIRIVLPFTLSVDDPLFRFCLWESFTQIKQGKYLQALPEGWAQEEFRYNRALLGIPEEFTQTESELEIQMSSLREFEWKKRASLLKEVFDRDLVIPSEFSVTPPSEYDGNLADIIERDPLTLFVILFNITTEGLTLDDLLCYIRISLMCGSEKSVCIQGSAHWVTPEKWREAICKLFSRQFGGCYPVSKRQFDSADIGEFKIPQYL